MACRGGPWPSRGPCAAAGVPGRCKHRPLQRFVITRGSHLAADLPLAVGAGFTAPAGAFRRPTAAQRRLLGRRSRPQVFARRGVRRDEGIPPYGRPGTRGCPGWPDVPGWHVGEGHAPPEPPRRRKPGGYGVRPCGGRIFPVGRRARRRGHSGHFKTDTATRPRACLAGPGARFCSAFCFNAPGIRPRGRQGCGGLSRGCRSCARRCAAAARRAAKR